MISMKALAGAIAEHDFAVRAASYGANGSRSVLINAIANLPKPEFETLRGPLGVAIEAAERRTTARLKALGVDIDCPFPFPARSATDSPDEASKLAQEAA
jgi:hypothetical protein